MCNHIDTDEKKRIDESESRLMILHWLKTREVKWWEIKKKRIRCHICLRGNLGEEAWKKGQNNNREIITKWW